MLWLGCRTASVVWTCPAVAKSYWLTFWPSSISRMRYLKANKECRLRVCRIRRCTRPGRFRLANRKYGRKNERSRIDHAHAMDDEAQRLEIMPCISAQPGSEKIVAATPSSFSNNSAECSRPPLGRVVIEEPTDWHDGGNWRQWHVPDLVAGLGALW